MSERELKLPFLRGRNLKSVNWVSVIIFLFIVAVIPLSCMRAFKPVAEPVKPSEALKVSKPAEPVRPDFAAIKNITKRKAAFFNYLRPIVREENSTISRDRRHLLLLYMKSTGKPGLSAQDRKWLKGLGEKYGVDLRVKDDNSWRKLIRRVDIVPERLALVQSAVESRWGMSRFATEGNSFFGEWCFDKGCGEIPEKREPGKYHEVEAFSTVRESVQSYLKNLNTHQAYRSFRTRRHALRLQGRQLDGLILVPGLEKYSERRDEYVRQIRDMMQQNKDLLDG